MRILFVTPRFPYPPRKGDQLVSFQRLKSLSIDHEITLVTLYEHKNELAHLKQLEPYCQAIHVIKHSRLKAWSSLVFNFLFSILPLQVLYFKSFQLSKKLESILRSQNFDAIHGFTLRAAPYIESFKGVRVLDMIDSWQIFASRQIPQSKGLKLLLYRIEEKRIINFENHIGNMADHIILVSELDRDAVGSHNSLSIPLGVDLSIPSPRPEPALEPQVIFSGNMGYQPNIDAVEWFTKHVWPLILAAVPSAIFHIAGANPSPKVRALSKQPGIQVLGAVPNMAESLCSAWVAVAPMQSGSGMQFKILEAMACRIPVVSTSLGLGSIKAKNGVEILLADTPRMFADSVISLLRNSEHANRVAQMGESFVITNHNWGQSAKLINDMYLKSQHQ